VTSLLILSFLSILGGALLSATTVDVTIANNYQSNAQTHLLAESGIEAGRAALSSAGPLNDALQDAGGPDGALASSTGLVTLLATDDQPLIPSDPASRAAGQLLLDTEGNPVGRYHVWLRNDHVDGESSIVDTNRVVTLVSIARIGNSTKTIEVVLRRGDFPTVPAALTLNGPIDYFDNPSSNNFYIDGDDGNDPPEASEHAIGVISALDDATVSSEIAGPPNRSSRYTGGGGVTPDVQNVAADLNSAMLTVHGLEDYVETFAAAADSLYNPDFDQTTSIGNVGDPADYPVTVVNGNASVGPVTGYGVLVVRGNLTLSGNTSWYGLILVVGQGRLTVNGAGNGEIRGAIFVAKTRDTASRSAANPLGDLLPNRGDIYADYNGGGRGGLGYHSGHIDSAMSSLPYRPIWVVEW
jgi:hypothetical protein